MCKTLNFENGQYITIGKLNATQKQQIEKVFREIQTPKTYMVWDMFSELQHRFKKMFFVNLKKSRYIGKLLIKRPKPKTKYPVVASRNFEICQKNYI